MHQGGAEEATNSTRVGPVPPEAPALTLAREVLQRYAGSYKASRGIAKVAVGDDGGLTIQLGNGQPVRLLAVTQTEFRTDGRDAKVVFHSEADKVSHLVFHQGEEQTRADRQPTAS